MPIKAFALDLDGTLVDSIPDLAAAANHTRAAFGLPPLEAARIRYHVGDGIPSLVHRALTDDRDGQAPADRHTEALAIFLAYYGEHLADHTRPYPGVVDTLAAMQAAGFRLALITNKAEAPARQLVEALGLACFFDLIVGGDTLAEKKPSGLPLRHVAAKLGLAPADIAMVGDSHNDVATARAAGSPAIAVSYGYEPVDHLGADCVAATLAAAFEFGKNRA